MKMAYFETKKGRIELIPMIDVMFFLLVFFMILTLRMIPNQGLHLALPQATTAKVLPRPQVVISLSANGAIHVHGQRVTRSELRGLLAQAPGKRRPVVTIAAAKNVPFQDFVAVMDAARKAGVASIGIATVHP
ncbi:MAG: ExbD/TolR family protein [Acidiferrobacter sp.]